MKIDSIEFEFVCNLEPERGADGIASELMPQARYKNARGLPLNAYGAGPFCRLRVPNTYRTSGVYILVVNEVTMYVGECVNLSSRYNSGYGNISPRNCFKEGQETNCRLNALIYKEAQVGNTVSLWFYATPEHKSLERTMRSIVRPAWNREKHVPNQAFKPTGHKKAMAGGLT